MEILAKACDGVIECRENEDEWFCEVSKIANYTIIGVGSIILTIIIFLKWQSEKLKPSKKMIDRELIKENDEIFKVLKKRKDENFWTMINFMILKSKMLKKKENRIY